MRMFPYSPINYSVAEPYDVRCTFDEEHHEWIYVFSTVSYTHLTLPTKA